MARRISIGLVLLLLITHTVGAQIGSSGYLRYQAVARDNSGNPIVNQLISVRTGVYSGSVLEWEENHSVTTNSYGVFLVAVGGGVSTGAGSVPSFSAIDWSTGLHKLSVSIDYTGGASYQLMGQSQ